MGNKNHNEINQIAFKAMYDYTTKLIIKSVSVENFLSISGKNLRKKALLKKTPTPLASNVMILPDVFLSKYKCIQRLTILFRPTYPQTRPTTV